MRQFEKRFFWRVRSGPSGTFFAEGPLRVERELNADYKSTLMQGKMKRSNKIHSKQYVMFWWLVWKLYCIYIPIQRNNLISVFNWYPKIGAVCAR